MTAAPDEVWEALLACRDRALRVARARCADPHDAEDCVQEAMIRIAAMPNVDTARIGPLVSTVVANLAVDGHRARGRALRLGARLHSSDGIAPPPEEAVCEIAEAQWLWSLRGSLNQQDRRVLELKVAGRTVSESAAELGVTYKAAENALGRARKRLREAWAATAALLGILWGRRPSGPAAAVAAAPVALLATATLAILSPAHAPQPTAPRIGPAITVLVPNPSPAAFPPAVDPGPPPQLAANGEELIRSAAPGLAEPPAKSDGPPERVEVTRPIEIGEYRVAGPVTAEDHETGRTFVEEVVHCATHAPERVQNGVIGCPP